MSVEIWETIMYIRGLWIACYIINWRRKKYQFGMQNIFNDKNTQLRFGHIIILSDHGTW